MHIIEVFGRIFLSTIFLFEGINKIFNYESTIKFMESFNVPKLLAIPTIILEILFPLLLIIGYQAKLSALVLAIFTLTTALIFHTDFTNQMQLISFLKNFAIAGGFLILFINGAGKYSLDHKLS